MLSPGQKVDRYVVETVLGEGGMATVYRVRHTTLDSHHALKVLKLASTTIRERLIQEGRVQAKLQHPNLVPVTDVIDVDGAPGLVMQFIDGPSLEQLLKSRRLSIGQADELAVGIIRGVMEAHKIGFVHRDLKPGNILLQMVSGTLMPRVADFGLGKLLDSGEVSATRTGIAMGTPRYMAPEQIRDAKSADQRADVFSLGAILYELVCSAPAFESSDIIALFTAIGEGRYRPPRERVPDLPERMERAIVGALQPELEHRIQSCSALLAIWQGVAADESTPTWTETVMASASELSSGQDISGGPSEAPSPNTDEQTFDGSSLEPLAASEPPLSDLTFALAPEEPSLDGSGEVLATGGVPAQLPPPASPMDSTPAGPAQRSRPAAWLSAVVVAGLAVAVVMFAWDTETTTELSSAPASPATVSVDSPTESTVSPPASPAGAAPSTNTTVAENDDAASRPIAAGGEESGSAQSGTAPPASEERATSNATADRSSRRAAPTASAAEAGSAATTPSPASSPSPEPAESRLVLEGDASAFYIQGAPGRFPPGAVPPGTYTMFAGFHEEAAESMGRVIVREGASLTISCSSMTGMCRAKR